MSRKFFLMMAMVLICGLGAWTARAQSSEYATDGVGFVPYFLGVGPFAVEGDVAKALDTDYLGEAAGTAKAGDSFTYKDLKYPWRMVTTVPGSPVVNAAQAGLGNGENKVGYFVAYVVLENEAKLTVLWSGKDHAAIFINGKECGRVTDQGRLKADMNLIEGVAFKKGVNAIMVKLVATADAARNEVAQKQGIQNANRQWGLAVRLVGEGDLAMKGLAIVPSPDGKAETDARLWKAVDIGQAALDGPVSTYLVASQIGYVPSESKLAIATSLRQKAWTAIEIRDAKTDAVAFAIPKDGGKLVQMGRYDDVGQYITRVYFDEFNKPGRYYLYNAGIKLKSAPFDISEDVYKRLAAFVTRMFYFQRSGIDHDEKSGGKWAGSAYHEWEKAKNAKMYKWGGGAWTQIGTEVLDATPHDVRGGWYDAGDPNKYTKNEAYAHNYFMWAYDVNAKYVKDGDLNIPESGNGKPDLLKEAKWTTDYLLKIQRADGAVYDRVAHGGKYGEHGETQPQPETGVAEVCSGATLCATGAWAWAAVAWHDLDADYSKKCLDAAVKSWEFMEKNPAPWPVDANGKPRSVGSIDQNAGDPAGYGDQKQLRALAAATLFRATGEEKYKKIAEEWLKDPGQIELGYRSIQEMICHNYMLGTGADKAVVASYVERIKKDVLAYRDDALAGSKRVAYGATHSNNFHWGSNAAVASRTAVMLWYAMTFAPEAERASYVQAGDEYVAYLCGRNPTRWAFITNLQEIGATQAPQEMYHFWNQWTDEPDNRFLKPDPSHPNRVGAFPGYLLGGPADNPFDFPRSRNDFVVMEPSIMYQAPAVMMLQTLAGKAQEYRKAGK